MVAVLAIQHFSRRNRASCLLVSFEEFFRQVGLADHGAESSDGDVFAGMRYDDGFSLGVAVFGVASGLGDEVEVVGLDDFQKLLG